jgi:hypothetical protein
MLDRQFQMLQARGHALLVVCGLLVTGNTLMGYFFRGATGTMGFSLLRAAGGAFAVAAAAVVMIGVMRLQWITEYPGKTIADWLAYALEYRNRKSRAFRTATFLVLVSIIFYELSVIIVVYAKGDIRS